MARKSKHHPKKSSWKRNLLWFLMITALFTGLGVAGGAALGTFAIPFLGTVGGITLFGSIGFGLAMFVGVCAAIKAMKNWLTKSKMPSHATNPIVADSIKTSINESTLSRSNIKNNLVNTKNTSTESVFFNSFTQFFLGTRKAKRESLKNTTNDNNSELKL